MIRLIIAIVIVLGGYYFYPRLTHYLVNKSQEPKPKVTKSKLLDYKPQKVKVKAKPRHHYRNSGRGTQIYSGRSEGGLLYFTDVPKAQKFQLKVITIDKNTNRMPAYSHNGKASSNSNTHASPKTVIQDTSSSNMLEQIKKTKETLRKIQEQKARHKQILDTEL